jgi:hypothetical protein
MGKRDGYSAAPAFQWRVTGEWLEIYDYDSTVIWRMKALTVTAGAIVTDNGKGERETFKILASRAAN